jgi:hypothetical protein
MDFDFKAWKDKLRRERKMDELSRLMDEGKRLYEKRKAEGALIRYYVNNRSDDDGGE